MKKLLLLLATLGMMMTACEQVDNNGIPSDKTQAIKFQDTNTKLICTLHWDENEDGELSYKEAAAVADLGETFAEFSIMAFNELKFFTGLESISNRAFKNCESLVKITLPNSVTSIGDAAFEYCSSLTSVTIPDSVTSIGEFAFSDCSSLTSVTIPDSVTSIGYYAFYNCSSLTSVTIPDSVTSIGQGVFENCSSLTSVTIPDSVTSIGQEAFEYCTSLTSVTIPDSVTSIGHYAFEYCSSLTSVYCKPTTPPTGGYNMFSSNASGRKIYVPTASVEAYKSKSYWDDYMSSILGYDF